MEQTEKHHREKVAAQQRAIIATRICQLLHRRTLPFSKKERLGDVLTEEEFLKVHQTIMDEYQVDIITLDTIHDLGFILQKKITV